MNRILEITPHAYHKNFPWNNLHDRKYNAFENLHMILISMLNLLHLFEIYFENCLKLKFTASFELFQLIKYQIAKRLIFYFFISSFLALISQRIMSIYLHNNCNFINKDFKKNNSNKKKQDFNREHHL